MKYLFVILLTLPLGGCFLTAGTGEVTTLAPVCDALGQPIIYNSHDRNSAWHAGPLLAPSLAEHNSVGVNLHCPAFEQPLDLTTLPASAPLPPPRPATFLQRFTGTVRP